MRSSVPRRTDETEQVHRRADSRDRQGRRSRTEGGRPVSDARHHRADVLPLEGQIRRHGTKRDTAAQAARGRESTLEADRRGADAGYPGAQGGGRKKMVSPTARREAVGWLQTRGTSVRRACRVVGLSRATWRYERRADPRNIALLDRLQVHATARPRFGY